MKPVRRSIPIGERAMIRRGPLKSQNSRIIFPKMMCVLLLSGLLCVAAPANMPVAHASDAVSIVQKGNTVSVRAEGASCVRS